MKPIAAVAIAAAAAIAAATFTFYDLCRLQCWLLPRLKLQCFLVHHSCLFCLQLGDVLLPI